MCPGGRARGHHPTWRSASSRGSPLTGRAPRAWAELREGELALCLDAVRLLSGLWAQIRTHPTLQFSGLRKGAAWTHQLSRLPSLSCIIARGSSRVEALLMHKPLSTHRHTHTRILSAVSLENLTATYSTPATAEYTHSPPAHVLGPDTCRPQSDRLGTTRGMLSDHSGTKLATHNSKRAENHSSTWRFNTTALSNR